MPRVTPLEWRIWIRLSRAVLSTTGPFYLPEAHQPTRSAPREVMGPGFLSLCGFTVCLAPWWVAGLSVIVAVGFDIERRIYCFSFPREGDTPGRAT